MKIGAKKKKLTKGKVGQGKNPDKGKSSEKKS